MSPVRPHHTIVRTSADLFTLWQSLLGEGGFGRRSLWVLFLDGDGCPAPVIVPIDDIPRQPDDGMLAGLRAILAGLADQGIASTAVLLSRPGPRAMSGEDRRWARALTPLTSWPIHLATADHLQVFAPDDLVAA